MTRSETIGLIEQLHRAYPRFIQPSPLEPDLRKTISQVVDLWADMLSGIPASMSFAAARRHIATSRFPPTIAEILALTADMTAALPSPADVWQELDRLFNSGIAPNQPDKAYARMSPLCKSVTLAVGGWYALAMSDEGDQHVRRTFLQAAEQHIAAERERAITGQARLLEPGSQIAEVPHG